jgi:hypothetical protein
VSRALFHELRARGGMLAECARPPTDGDHPWPARTAAAPARAATVGPSPAQTAAAGPRAAGHEAEYELLLDMILEGSLLHYGSPRVIHTDDPDLALLLGDELYALGLARLATLGDLEAVAVLADVISRIAQANAEGAPERAGEIWAQGARAVGWGSDGANRPA